MFSVVWSFYGHRKPHHKYFKVGFGIEQIVLPNPMDTKVSITKVIISSNVTAGRKRLTEIKNIECARYGIPLPQECQPWEAETGRSLQVEAILIYISRLRAARAA